MLEQIAQFLYILVVALFAATVVVLAAVWCLGEKDPYD